MGHQAVIDHLLTGHSTLGVMPTGTGKSLCYRLPAGVSGGPTLEISQPIATTNAQFERLRDRGIAAAQ